MGADLCIHAFSNGQVSDQDLQDFFSSSLGSRWFNMRAAAEAQRSGRWEQVMSKFAELPQVNVGECSWLKAAISGDDKSFVPAAIQAVHDAIGEDCPVIDDDLIARIEAAMMRKNDTSYQVTDKNNVVEFLRSHMGKKALTISW